MAWALPEGAVLGIFGKRPEPGRVETRQAAAFGAEAAAEMHEAMLFDPLDAWADERVLAPGGRRGLVFAPQDAGPWFDPRVPAAYALQPQAEVDLGLRMRAFFEGECEDAATRVVLIGSVAPAIDPSIVISAFLCLEGRDVVLGPASSGPGGGRIGGPLAAPHPKGDTNHPVSAPEKCFPKRGRSPSSGITPFTAPHSRSASAGRRERPYPGTGHGHGHEPLSHIRSSSYGVLLPQRQ